MSDQTPNRLGAPTKYHDGIPDLLYNYFSEQRTFVVAGKDFPEFNSIEGFCAHIKIAKSTFYEWVKIHKDLSNAFSIAKNLQAKQLYNLGLNRIWAEGYAKMITINCTDMQDKVEHNIDKTTISIKIDDGDKEL